MPRSILAGSVTLLAAAANAPEPSARDSWHQALHRQCPLNHVEWAAGQSYDELLAAYSRSLSRTQSRRLERVADHQFNCGKVSAGFECEMEAYLRAAWYLGMLKDMAAFSCRMIRCEEPGICSRFPHMP